MTQFKDLWVDAFQFEDFLLISFLDYHLILFVKHRFYHFSEVYV